MIDLETDNVWFAGEPARSCVGGEDRACAGLPVYGILRRGTPFAPANPPPPFTVLRKLVNAVPSSLFDPVLHV